VREITHQPDPDALGHDMDEAVPEQLVVHHERRANRRSLIERYWYIDGFE
jgi:hypothetical protein